MLRARDNAFFLKDEVILAPLSESGRKSVEEMQKSLSTENSPTNSRVSISFEYILAFSSCYTTLIFDFRWVSTYLFNIYL